MSATELEPLGLDAAVITKLQTIISSDQVDDDAIIADVLGDNVASVPATAQIQGSNVKVHAPAIGKNFNGTWNKASNDNSTGKLNYNVPLNGVFKITVHLSLNRTVIIFLKASIPPAPRPAAVFVGNGTLHYVVSGDGQGIWR